MKRTLITSLALLLVACSDATAPAPGARTPHGRAASSLGPATTLYAYVVNLNSNTVSVINTATNTVETTVPVGNGPIWVSITPVTGMAYVSNYADNTVSVISTATNAVVATVPVGQGPDGIAITPDGNFAYVANNLSNSVSVISTATNTVVATIVDQDSPGSVAITADGARAYVVNAQSVSVIDVATNTVTTTVSVPAGNSGARDGPGVAITPDGAFVYVVIGAGNVAVLSTATNTYVATVSATGNVVGSNSFSVAFLPSGAVGYVAEAGFNELVMFDASNAVLGTIPVGSFPVYVAIIPDGTTAYVANGHDNTVSVLNTATNTVVGTVTVGSGPWGVAFAAIANVAPTSGAVWVGLKNSDDIGTFFDLRVEVLKNGGVLATGETDGVAGGSSGFNNAIERTISTLISPSTAFASGDVLAIRLSARIADGVSGHRSGTARLWYNDASANSRVDAYANGQLQTYYLAAGFGLSTTPGTGPRKSADVLVDRLSGGNPFKPFGTWSLTF